MSETRKEFKAQYEVLARKVIRARIKAAKAEAKADRLEVEALKAKLSIDAHCGDDCYKVRAEDDFRAFFYYDVAVDESFL